MPTDGATSMSTVRSAVIAVVMAFGFLQATVAEAAIPYGPGPIRYTVQAQPAPGTCHYRWINKTSGLVLAATE
jgi:hypothetical protein